LFAHKLKSEGAALNDFLTTSAMLSSIFWLAAARFRKHTSPMTKVMPSAASDPMLTNASCQDIQN